MPKQKREFDRLGFLVRRLFYWFLISVVPYGLLCFVAFPLLGFSTESASKIFKVFGGGLFGFVGLCETLCWLFGGYRLRYFRQLKTRQRAAQKRREPCKLSLELGLEELNEQVKIQPPSEYISRMRDYLTAVKAGEIRKSGSSLWEADGLKIGFHPPRSASFLRFLLQRIKLTLEKY